MLLWTLGYVHLFELVSFSLDIYPAMELLIDHMVVVFFFGSSIFSILRKFHVVLHSGCTNLDSPNSVRLSPFFHILTNICYLCFFDDRHSDRYEVISYCGCDLYFSDNWQYWTSFHLPDDQLYVLTEKLPFYIFCPLFRWVVCAFWYWVEWAVYIFWILAPYQLYFCKWFPLLWKTFSV